MIVEPACLADLVEIIDIVGEYFHETAFTNMTFDRTNAGELVNYWLENGKTWVVREEGKIVALCVMTFQKTFFTELVANNEILYVAPEFRGAGIGRKFVNAMIKIAKSENVKAIYSSCLSGVSEKNNNLYKNMLVKQGFVTLGTCLLWS